MQGVVLGNVSRSTMAKQKRLNTRNVNTLAISNIVRLAKILSQNMRYSRGLKHAACGPHVAHKNVLFGPRCFSGILKYLTFVLPSALKKDAAK